MADQVNERLRSAYSAGAWGRIGCWPFGFLPCQAHYLKSIDLGRNGIFRRNHCTNSYLKCYRFQNVCIYIFHGIISIAASHFPRGLESLSAKSCSDQRKHMLPKHLHYDNITCIGWLLILVLERPLEISQITYHYQYDEKTKRALHQILNWSVVEATWASVECRFRFCRSEVGQDVIFLIVS